MESGRETFIHVLDGEVLNIEVSYAVEDEDSRPTIQWQARVSTESRWLDVSLTGTLPFNLGAFSDAGALAAIAARRALAHRLDHVREALKAGR